MGKKTYYFQHDYGARNDPKLQAVLMDLGQIGKGVYWDVVEMLYEQGGKLPLDYKRLAFQLHTKTEVLKQLVEDFHLFENDGKEFWSESVNRRLAKQQELADKKRAAVKARWSKAKKALERETRQREQTEELALTPTMEDTNANYRKVVELWHRCCPSLPKVITLTDSRKSKVKRRLQEMHYDYDKLEEVLTRMEHTPFLKGDNDRGWVATFDWLFSNDNNLIKVMEGKYDSNAARNKIDTHINDIWK